MADSDIVITSLVANGGGRLVSLEVEVTLGLPLPYLEPDTFEFWSSLTNDRTTAVLVGAVPNQQFIHTGMGDSITLYYWCKVKDGSDSYTDWYPLSPTAGVSATTSAAATPGVGAGAVGTTELADNAVTKLKMADNSVGTLELIDGETTNAKLADDARPTAAFFAAPSPVAVPAAGVEAQFALQAIVAIGGPVQIDLTGIVEASTSDGSAFGRVEIRLYRAGTVPPIDVTWAYYDDDKDKVGGFAIAFLDETNPTGSTTYSATVTKIGSDPTLFGQVNYCRLRAVALPAAA